MESGEEKKNYYDRSRKLEVDFASQFFAFPLAVLVEGLGSRKTDVADSPHFFLSCHIF